MTQTPFISVVVPIRNEAKYIKECLMSIVEQDYGLGNFEIIVVDGMSDDQTQEVVRNLQQEYPNITLLENPERYVPFALNKAIAVAKGEIIARVDGHAALEKDYLTQAVHTINETGAEGVGGQIISVNESKVGKAIALAMSSKFGVGNSRFRTGGQDGYVDTVAFAVYPKDVFKKIGLFDEFMIRSQDDEFNFRLRDFGGKVYLTSKMRSKYFPRSSVKKLWQQYFGYGLFKVRLFQKYPRLMQLRHFVPLAFVLSIFGSAILALLSGIAWPFFTIAVTYLVGSFVFALKICKTSGLEYLPLLPFIFATLHLSYGCGFLFGLIKFSLFKPPQNTIPQIHVVMSEQTVS